MRRFQAMFWALYGQSSDDCRSACADVTASRSQERYPMPVGSHGAECDRAASPTRDGAHQGGPHQRGRQRYCARSSCGHLHGNCDRQRLQEGRDPERQGRCRWQAKYSDRFGSGRRDAVRYGGSRCGSDEDDSAEVGSVVTSEEATHLQFNHARIPADYPGPESLRRLRADLPFLRKPHGVDGSSQSVNGSRGNTFNYFIDGVDNKDNGGGGNNFVNISPDALEQFKTAASEFMPAMEGPPAPASALGSRTARAIFMVWPTNIS